ncbi:MAG: hypothetical protein COY19_09610, partial [Candidatus Marinimicrobia bacterium CG_4_10_14_0_2_um_filter_48_9]
MNRLLFRLMAPIALPVMVAVGEVSAISGPLLPTPLDTIDIRLENAILLGLENNPTILVQKLAPELSQAAVKQQKGAFDPVVTANVQRSENKSQRQLGTNANPVDLTTTQTSFGAGISQSLPTGTDVAITTSMSGSISSLYTDQYAGSIGMTVNQSLLRG